MGLELLNIQAEVAGGESFEVLEGMKSNMTEVNFVLDTLLHWGKKHIKGVYLDASKFIINSRIQDTIDQLAMSMRMKNVNAHNLIPPNTSVYTDPDQFSFVIRNLMSNAVKYSFDGGDIEIGLLSTSRQDQVIVYVKDRGVGISEADRSTIFTPLSKSQVGTVNELGNSLALVVSKEFMAFNGGEIWFDDNEDGPGTTFFVQFPI